MSLPEPFGKCEEFNPVPVSQCQLDCKTEKVVNACGCHDLYMRPSENSKDKLSVVLNKALSSGNILKYWAIFSATGTLCSLEKKFICAFEELGMLDYFLFIIRANFVYASIASIADK